MKPKFFTLIILLFTIVSFAQSQSKQLIPIQQKPVAENTIYQLFPTPNIWTYIKLDTRNGKMWQVHFSVNADGFEGQIVLNSVSLTPEVDEIKGRFTLYKTENTYNLILLDQIDGRVWQVQWNSEEEKRFISRIY
ncbi:hypothetical protein [Flavobacterium stagni]|uniref:Uncharacterized protein n=1 Tax=Flavobacterium stagni TaxID=2506421 RepID=A0A4Q1K8J6_9FLAO|nr:hypothetical protein [Flavobacterium stagni]RXR22148.1 hypothetical protein EQG61_09095 [Flavobacterium stagni]